MAAAAEGDAFKSRKDMEAWLGRMPSASATIAARCSLRVLPLTLPDLASHITPVSGRLALAVIRANFVSWAACQNEISLELARAAQLAAIAIEPSSFRFQVGDQSALYAAASAYSAVLSAAGDDIQNAADAIAAAAQAVADLPGRRSIIWDAAHADGEWLVRHPSVGPMDLAVQPLWLPDVRKSSKFKVNFPPWARERFDAFDRSFWVQRGPWGVWMDWYRGILPNSKPRVRDNYFSDSSAFKIASMPDAFWRGDPHRVTAEVADLVGWSWNASDWEWPNEEEEEEEEPSLESTGFSNSDIASTALGEPTSQLIETVGIHSDEATSVDQLDRWPFAKALVEHMDDVYWQQLRREESEPFEAANTTNGNDGDGFAMHIHAPWGAGKTSVIKMMREMLERKDRSSKNGRVAPQWVVVEFNAWRNERRNPPWWPLLEAIKSACLEELRRSEVFDALSLNRYWLWWKVRTDLLPYVVSALVFSVSAIALWYTRDANGAHLTFENGLKLVAAVAAIIVSFVGASRFAVFGSVNNAKFYDDLSQDPLKRIVRLFDKVVSTTRMPICVVIDDLDRCRSDYVVSLLQGVQTIFRHRSVAYVVAADRNWIKTSFENQYGSLKDSIGNAGQPLGYLFLEKVFQVSTPLPAVSEARRAAYWDALLKGPVGERARPGHPSAGNLSESEVEYERVKIREESPSLTRKDADEWLKVSDTPAMRAALALEISTSKAAEVEATHLLAQFKDSLPDIPRVMKRMINAFAIRQTVGLLVDNGVPVKALARWTIIEQSYPALADRLAETPDLVSGASSDTKDTPFSTILNSRRFAGIVGSGDDRLTAKHIEIITQGSASGEARQNLSVKHANTPFTPPLS